MTLGATEWMHKWESNGFVNCKGYPVANKDLIMELSDLIDDRTARTTFIHVPGHSNDYGNYRADVSTTGLLVLTAGARSSRGQLLIHYVEITLFQSERGRMYPTLRSLFRARTLSDTPRKSRIRARRGVGFDTGGVDCNARY
jgi:hypothetical protein